MTSAAEDPSSLIERAFTAAAGPAEDDPHAEVLDAARDLFARQGFARTTMEDVARAAGLSRITVYRRLESKEALVEQVVFREFRAYFNQFLAAISSAHTVEDRVAVGFVGSMTAIRNNPLIRGLMTADPQLVVPTILGEGGRTMVMVSQFLAGQLRREQDAGHVGADVDVDVVADLMVRISGSLLMTPSPHVDLDDGDQLADIARRYLVPMLRS
ncbi:TetR/AcrR family transcriptional regulator [Nocardioides caeni]|uniref:TetR/AcrR family transcriptional regulator n=1 Tax=Nocardioides caeni TaxID=574700 RepID=A0A4S8N2R7_9ACTN|nr:TetR/AcrR family transcriptional regulator [Nocardioides caeni]THV10065.1 TetR/AcrR family transcriptional regulator [Nocardioides caeni]